MNPIFYRDYSSGGEKPFPYLIIEDFYDEEELGLGLEGTRVFT